MVEIHELVYRGGFYTSDLNFTDENNQFFSSKTRIMNRLSLEDQILRNVIVLLCTQNREF